MTRKEIIEIASQLYCPGQFNGDAALRSAFQEGAAWAYEHPSYHYNMDDCPNCKYILFYNPYYNNYFVGELDKNNNLVIDNEIQGKAFEFYHLYWTDLPEFNKDTTIE